MEKPAEQSHNTLPSRVDVHRKKKKKKKPLPTTFVLVIIFICLPFVILITYFIQVTLGNERMATEQPYTLINEPSQITEQIETIEHSVKEGETLSSISVEYYGDETAVERIKEYNQLADNQLFEGQVLKIPIEK
ncbi:LysM peptidoglycan-binding domain-containing protein [Bacillus carboniphilus]|uniref:LysM peptidoglycan-binding domain-containing protein n=1 Tax=Bacillus carboniphilus TaxID=86663 RepID=A0ABY9JWK9_9BACI|nr:LysM peptidoglycan-binding domain-containing protein [Bacillus carboniphilus]WLR43765.1 LysM peptidoglycan-binding domain-containing protein [Bacillus carboniphilus]